MKQTILFKLNKETELPIELIESIPLSGPMGE